MPKDTSKETPENTKTHETARTSTSQSQEPEPEREEGGGIQPRNGLQSLELVLSVEINKTIDLTVDDGVASTSRAVGDIPVPLVEEPSNKKKTEKNQTETDKESIQIDESKLIEKEVICIKQQNDPHDIENTKEQKSEGVTEKHVEKKGEKVVEKEETQKTQEIPLPEEEEEKSHFSKKDQKKKIIKKNEKALKNKVGQKRKLSNQQDTPKKDLPATADKDSEDEYGPSKIKKRRATMSVVCKGTESETTTKMEEDETKKTPEQQAECDSLDALVEAITSGKEVKKDGAQ